MCASARTQAGGPDPLRLEGFQIPRTQKAALDSITYCSYTKSVKITFDPAKRDRTLADRGLDFAEAKDVFSGATIDIEDLRFAYPEMRVMSVGHLRSRMVIVVWTPADDGRRIISMRKANDREKARYGKRLGKG